MGFVIAMWGRFGDRKHEKAKKEAFHVQLSRIENYASIRGRADLFPSSLFYELGISFDGFW